MQIKYPVEANNNALLFLSCIMHLIHFNLMSSYSSLNLLNAYGLCHMQFNIACGSIQLGLFYQLVYFNAPFNMSCIIPCLMHLCHVLIVRLSLRCLFASYRLDDDVETDEAYDHTSEELAQYQATELAGKYSLT